MDKEASKHQGFIFFRIFFLLGFYFGERWVFWGRFCLFVLEGIFFFFLILGLQKYTTPSWSESKPGEWKVRKDLIQKSLKSFSSFEWALDQARSKRGTKDIELGSSKHVSSITTPMSNKQAGARVLLKIPLSLKCENEK